MSDIGDNQAFFGIKKLVVLEIAGDEQVGSGGNCPLEQEAAAAAAECHFFHRAT